MKYQNRKTTIHPQKGGGHFKPQENSQTSTNGGRHFKPQENNQTLINGGRHFKPPHFETDKPMEALNRSTQQTLVEEDEVLK